MQREVVINEIKIPVIEERSELWYPISYMGDKVLLKDLSPAQLRQNGYGKYFKEFEIDFGEYTGGLQNTYCTSEEGLKVILGNSKIGRLSIEQKKAMNGLLIYLEMELIIEDERFVKNITQEKILKYSEYIQDCIKDILKDDPNILWQRCSKCGNYYPYHINFFRENPHAGKDYPLYTFCRDCKWTESRGKDSIRRNSIRLSGIYHRLGIDTYKLYKNDDIIGIYKDWIEKKYSKSVPLELNNKESYLEIIKYLYDIGEITKENLTFDYIKEHFKLSSLGKYVKHFELYQYLFNNDSINYPWEYPNFLLPQDMPFEQYQKIFNNYLEMENIKIDNIYHINYMDICNKCGLKRYVNHDMLGFVVKYYNNQYPGYKFKVVSTNYWKDKDNRIFDLKYLIEQDMKIPLEKIPLYLTLENLRKNSGTLRNVARKYYKSNLWQWVNEVYPNKFIEEDFNITVIRNVFDSADEHAIHDILTSKFKNVIYNQRNSDNTITINHMQPDWFIFTDNWLWVVEYFGIDIEHKNYNERINYYQKKTKSKLERYKSMDWLGKIYIYPDDLKENFKGLEEKLKVIV